MTVTLIGSWGGFGMYAYEKGVYGNDTGDVTAGLGEVLGVMAGLAAVVCKMI